MEKKCSRCGKSFNLDNKTIKSVDTDGNPLRIDLCGMCELDNAVEEIMRFKHISRKEAEKYVFNTMFNTMNDVLDNVTLNKKSTTNNRIKRQDFKHTSGFKYTSAEIIPNAVVKVVKDNEIR